MQHCTQCIGRSFREWLLDICGYKIWQPTHNDPRIKGPQPRILTRRQWEAMEKIRRKLGNDSEDSEDTAVCFSTVNHILH